MSALIRIATRQSPLALWQAEHVKSRLQEVHAGLRVELIPLSTAGDRWLGTPLVAVGGKGLFVKELEEALLDGRADLAVHSMKDVPVQQPAGLGLHAYLASGDPRDAFVSKRFTRLDELPTAAVVGTSSLRRQSQLRAMRPDLVIKDLRGNVGTRLRKLDEGMYDAIILACAGLQRLGLQDRIREALDPERFVPAIGQGIVGIECRTADAATQALLAPLHDPDSALRLQAERALNARLGGACQVPVGGFARVAGGRVHLSALVASPDGRRVLRDTIAGPAEQAPELGRKLAERLLASGAAGILQAIGIPAA